MIRYRPSRITRTPSTPQIRRDSRYRLSNHAQVALDCFGDYGCVDGASVQVAQPSKSPYERRGLYHATVRGKVVSPSGNPVAGVHMQLKAGRLRSLPVVDVVSGADGR